MPRGTPGTLLVPIPTYVGPKLRPEECLLAHPPKPNTHLCRPKTNARRMLTSSFLQSPIPTYVGPKRRPKEWLSAYPPFKHNKKGTGPLRRSLRPIHMTHVQA